MLSCEALKYLRICLQKSFIFSNHFLTHRNWIHNDYTIMKSFLAVIATTLAMLPASTAQAVEICGICYDTKVKYINLLCDNGGTSTCSYLCVQEDVDAARNVCCMRIANLRVWF